MAIGEIVSIRELASFQGGGPLESTVFQLDLCVCVCVCVTWSGVMGVGKETALQFLRAAKSGSHSTSDVLDQFQEWRNGSITEGLYCTYTYCSS